MERLIGGRRVEVRAKSGHWSRLIPGRRFARFQVGNFRGPQLLFVVAAVETVSRLDLLGGFLHPPGSCKSRACGYAAWAKGAQLRITHELYVFTASGSIVLD